MTLEEALPCDCDGLNRPEHLTGCPAIHRPAIEQLRAADQARIAELEAALRFYADPETWTTPYVFGPAVADKGEKARAALTCKTCGGDKWRSVTGEAPSRHNPTPDIEPCPTCGGSDE